MNLKEIRKKLHECAEVSGQEKMTKQLLMEILKHHNGKLLEGQDGCSLYMLYDFQKEKTIMLRAEMDGLMIDGKARHGCGHDGHMTMLCGISKWLSQQKKFHVNVLLVFQSSEESGAGAKQVISDPLFQKVCPDEAIALHVYPMKQTGFYVRYGAMCAAGREVNISFCGPSGHCALQLKETALHQAIEFLHRLHHMDFEDGFLSVNVIRAGSSRNQTAEKAELEGTLRSLSFSAEKRIMEWLKQFPGTFHFSTGYPWLRNHSHLTKRSIECGAQLLDEPLWICDDFAYVAQCIPSVYVLMGMESAVPLHHADFGFNDDLLETGMDFLRKMLLKS